MSKLPTMYIPILHHGASKNQPHQMLSTKRMKHLSSFLPSMEELGAHLVHESKLIKEVENYQPEPYMIYLSVENYDMIINELRSKHSRYYSDSVFLMLSSKSAPIIKIKQRIEPNSLQEINSEYEKH